MEGHEVHAAVLLVHVVGVHEQGHGIQKGLQQIPVRIVKGGFKLAHVSQKLLHVVRSDLIILLLVLLEIGVVADAFEQIRGKRRERLLAVFREGGFHDFGKGGELGPGPKAQGLGVQHHGEERQIPSLGLRAQLLQSRRADAPPGHVDDPGEGHVVVGIAEEPQIGQHILHLGAAEEGGATVDLVGDAVALKDHLQNAALGVSAVEDGEAVIPAAHAAAVQDAVADIHRFLPLRPALVDRDGEAVGPVRPQALVLSAMVVFDDPVGTLQDLVGGAVVLLETNHPGAGEILFEFQDVADIRAPPAVDALIVVAHHAQVPMLLRQQAHNVVLGHVGVLILVHQNIAEPIAILLQDVRPLLEKLNGL